MNDNMQVWLEALRSGQYSQTKGALDDFDSETGQHYFCCLGVACDLAVRAGVDVKVWPVDGASFVAYDGESGVLPKKVKNWLGVKLDNPKIVVENPHYTGGANRLNNPRHLINELVTELNDDDGLTFDQIADLIEWAGGFAEEV